MIKPAVSMIKPTLDIIKPALSMIKLPLNMFKLAFNMIKPALSKPTLTLTKLILGMTKIEYVLSMTVLTRVVLDRPCPGGSYDLLLEEGFCDVVDGTRCLKCSPGGRYDNMIKPALSIINPAYSIINLTLRTSRITKPTLS